jgi:hypothetical protein
VGFFCESTRFELAVPHRAAYLFLSILCISLRSEGKMSVATVLCVMFVVMNCCSHVSGAGELLWSSLRSSNGDAMTAVL